MSAATTAADPLQRLQGLLTALENLGDPVARVAAQELVRAVIELHGVALVDLLAIVDEAGAQPADTLPLRFAANPRVGGLLLLHGLHPQDLITRARHAVEHLRPFLGVRGVRADFVDAHDGMVRVRVTASGQKTRRPPAAEIRQEIEDAVMAAAPDAAGLAIEGLEATSEAHEVYVPVATIAVRGAVHG